MSESPFDQHLFRIGAETIEALAMMFLVPEEETARRNDGPRRTIGVRFSGPFSGQLTLSASETLLPELASNMLGLQAGEPAGPEQQLDALKELGNVICGNLLPVLAGPMPVFQIGAPEELAGSSAGSCVATARLGTNAGIVELALITDKATSLLDGACALSSKSMGQTA